MTAASRRAAGTRTFTDVLLSWTFIRRRTPEQDIRDLAAGQALEVAVLSTSLGGVQLRSIGGGNQIPVTRRGSLLLTAGQPPVWRERRTDRIVSLTPPFALGPAAERHVRIPGPLEWFSLTTGDGAHEVAIPKKDALLVRAALAEGPVIVD
ncbi:hypothetical protein ACPA54_30105 [Uniformispora flossi]|uniref:hypothetical protein n=1 Tax=Uniformispora flossi TaxID=3390723 RepID=UPI003C2CCBF6